MSTQVNTDFERVYKALVEMQKYPSRWPFSPQLDIFSSGTIVLFNPPHNPDGGEFGEDDTTWHSPGDAVIGMEKLLAQLEGPHPQPRME